METVYLNPTDFKKVKPTQTFPNPNVIEGKVKGKICRIVKTCNITYTKTSIEDANWFKISKDSYILRCENGHFPTNILMTVENRRFKDGLNIGATVGSYLGSANLSVINLKKAIELLEKNNFTVTENK